MFRATHSDWLWTFSQSGATTAKLFRAWRRVSPTHSKRLRARMTPSTWVESVRCRPRAVSHFLSRHFSNSSGRIFSSAEPATKRERNSLSTVLSNPESVSSRPSRYFQSIRLRTASAACRSERFSAYCSRLTSISRQGASAGCPREGNKEAKSPSENKVPSSSRRRRQELPRGKAARATRAVSSGTGPIGCGCRDMRILQQRKKQRTAARSGWSYPATANHPIDHSRIRQRYQKRG